MARVLATVWGGVAAKRADAALGPVRRTTAPTLGALRVRSRPAETASVIANALLSHGLNPSPFPPPTAWAVRLARSAAESNTFYDLEPTGDLLATSASGLGPSVGASSLFDERRAQFLLRTFRGGLIRTAVWLHVGCKSRQGSVRDTRGE